MNVAEAELTHTEELAGTERPPRPEKVEEVERLKNVLSEAVGIYLTDFRGIDVEKVNALRLRFREAGVEYTVVKNNLLKRAAEGVGLEEWIADLEGPTAMAVGMEDPVAPAKVIKEFQEDHKREGDFLEFKRGLLHGEAIGADTFRRLATLPGRDELIARVLYMFAYPLRGLVTALSGLPRNLVYALEDLRSKREAEKPVIEPAEEPVAAEEPTEEPVASEETIEEPAQPETTDEEAAGEPERSGPDEANAEEPAVEEETSKEEIESGEGTEPDPNTE
jgi:large subunit ribosomal protein L10